METQVNRSERSGDAVERPPKCRNTARELRGEASDLADLIFHVLRCQKAGTKNERHMITKTDRHWILRKDNIGVTAP